MALTTKVLLVDDSSVVRRLLAAVIEADPGFELAGEADEGGRALELVAETDPDVVVLDLIMPGVDGLQTLLRIEAEHPGVRVVVFSNADMSDRTNLGKVLESKSVARVAKPTGALDVEQALATIKRTLIPRLRANASVAAPKSRTVAPPIHALCVASSTGGPHALEAVFSRLPVLSLPTFVVQHISATFSSRLASQLDHVCRADVAEASEGEKPEPGVVYIAPGGSHLTLSRRGIDVAMSLDDGPPVNSCQPSADVLFQTAAEVYGSNQLGLVLTGIGEDGLAGCKALTSRGASVLVQDEESSVVWGMPGAVAKAGLATEIVPLEDIAARIDRLVTIRSKIRP